MAVLKTKSEPSLGFDDTEPGSNQQIAGVWSRLTQIETLVRIKFDHIESGHERIFKEIQRQGSRTVLVATLSAIGLFILAVALTVVTSLSGGDDQVINTNTSRATTRDQSTVTAPIEQRSDKRVRIESDLSGEVAR